MKHKINLAIQVLPRSETAGTYQLVDEAIRIVGESGLKYQVCPFETVIEGDYNTIMEVVRKVQEGCFAAGADELLVNIKIQARKDADVTIEEKMDKYT
jgi:uncharacterized protein (TIGR00106 family)